MPKRSQTPPKYPNHLREHIHNNGLTLNEVAQETDIPLRTLSDYCSGKLRIPRQRLESLAQIIGCTPEEIVPKFEPGEASAEKQAFYWHIPYPRNPFFTGREQLLQKLYETFNADTSIPLTHIQALCGLGGVGKTHLALEYPYRYHHAYDAVFWLKADTRESLLADFVGIAHLLNLPEQHAEEQMIMVTAVLRWLETHARWLLIFDNADDLSILPPFMPPAFGGHMLLTTRAQAVNRLAHKVTVECMTVEVGTLLLLRRAGLLSSQAPLEQTSAAHRLIAFQIIEELGGLPLAIDQVGAYIEETAYHLEGYLKLYHKQRADLLKRRGSLATDHVAPVATTWTLSFERIEQIDPLAIFILRLCAFLDPDAIPEEILKEGLQECGPTEVLPVDELRINATIEVLLRFSLIQRNIDTHMLTIHRLVQIVIQDSMDEETQQLWARRTVYAVYHCFPHPIMVENWQVCQRCLPHVQLCALLIEQYNFLFPEAAQLMNQGGYYLRERAFYKEAEMLFQQAIAIRQHIFGIEHLDTAQSIYNLARLYFEQGKYTEAEQLHLQALDIRQQLQGTEHLFVAQSLNSLALLYWFWGKYEKAESLFQKALPMRERLLGAEHPDTAHCLNNLALLYVSQGKYEAAEKLHRRVLEIRKKVLPPNHLDTAQSLQNLAFLYYTQGESSKYDESQSLYLQSLKIREEVLGEEHPQTAKSLHNLALLYEVQKKFVEAEQLYLRVLAIRRRVLGAENLKTIAAIENYASLLRKMNRLEEALALESQMKVTTNMY